ncbi:MAG: glycosyltransferase [Anaerolineae bacterium]
MYNVGHYVITYQGSSWLAAQIHDSEAFHAYLYSWARTTEDAITGGGSYRQPLPHLGMSFMGRRATLGLALVWERLLHGTTRAVTAAMRRDSIDVLHAHFGRAGYYALPIVRQLDIPLITSFYGYDVSEYPAQFPIWREYYRELFARLDFALVLGARMRERLVELGCPPERIRIHHLGVNIEAIRYQPRRWQPGEPLRILIASEFRERKGIPYALEALAKFAQETPVEITIIGDAADHPDGVREKQKIMAAIEKHQLAPVMRLLGKQPYKFLLEQAYQHHIFMGPSITAQDGDMEGTPMVLVDMAATGMPLISTTHSDVPEIIRHGETGLLAAERDVQGLLDHLRWFAAHPVDWETMTQAGRRHVEAEFDRAKQNQRLEATYLEAIANRRSG